MVIFYPEQWLIEACLSSFCTSFWDEKDNIVMAGLPLPARRARACCQADAAPWFARGAANQHAHSSQAAAFKRRSSLIAKLQW